METVIEAIPQTGDIRLTIEVSAKQNFSGRSAQRLVGRFVADEISYLLRAGEPHLVVSERLYWRVPVQLAFPGRGVVGTVGALDVDVETGQIRVTPQDIAEITSHAERLAV
ncbi:MAG: hypothetical protein NZ528_03725 [Caldilineales bacterium]|nr:hypothetical protein [Caldilineales bacterium]MDW8318104.1 hypothetical protein [Anaerolineae bacterium]